MSNLVSYFSVKGLNGYKNISADFTNSKPSILIAENGSSKTNFIKMLAYLLEGRFFSLNEFKFDSLDIEFNHNKKKIHVKSKELSKFVEAYKSNFEFAFRRVTSTGISFDDYLLFLKNKYNNDNFNELKNEPIIRRLYVSTPLDFKDIREMLSRSKEQQDKIFNKYKNRKQKNGFNPVILDICIGDSFIQYLPTYRRIESSYKEINYYNEDPFSLPLLETTEYNKMYFGLSDVQSTIDSLLVEIKEKTSLAINQGLLKFIEGNNSVIELDRNNGEDKEKLDYVELAFARVQDKKNTLNFPEKNKHVSMLLSNISILLEDVKVIENKLLKFIESVNLFFNTSGDKKKIKLNKETLDLKVLFIENEQEIPIDINNLSSGEKQILSMFASVHLSDKPKVFLIDEPEISLSLKWQRLLLPELTKAPFCKQLIAVTHSPFIFDNELSDFAIPMNISNNLELFK